jgi:glycosyltransferase involved in cell wall biosynthesis
LILVNDGSTDQTVAIARSADAGAVRVVDISQQVGKAKALSMGCLEARGDVLVFADVRQRWAPDAIERLLVNFSNPAIGAVSGELEIESAAGSLAGVGLYWRYEKWIRNNEGIVHSTVGVTGAICAVRRALFRPIPQGIVLDDVYWPMHVVLGGSRVVHDSTAVAFDTLPVRPWDELRRKIRTLSGNFQLLAAAPALLSPIRNPVWLQFFSHKVLRLAVPWLLTVLLATSAMHGSSFYRIVFWLQMMFYGVGLLGLMGALGTNSRVASAVSSFLLLNVAAWVAFWVWVTGGTARSWSKTVYGRAKPSAEYGQKIRVAYVIDTFMIGGTELNAIRTLETLDRDRFEVTVFHFSGDGPLRSRYEALGVRMIHLTISGFRSLATLREGWRFGLLLRRLGIQVVHSHDVYTNIFAAPWARVLGRCGVLASRRWFYDVPRPALNALNRWSYLFAHRVLANSGSVARLLVDQERLPLQKIVEIPNFLSEAAFSSLDPVARVQQRTAWGIPAAAYVVGIVARLRPVKNHAMLLKAIQALDNDTHLVAVGDGPELGSLKLLAKELGISSRVHFVGTITSSENLHQYFDASVLCSSSEGFPNSVIEALAARCPVVATRVGGVPDVVEDNVTGILIASSDVGALTESLSRLRLNPRLGARFGEIGVVRIRAGYSMQAVIPRLQDLYVYLAQYGTVRVASAP